MLAFALLFAAGAHAASLSQRPPPSETYLLEPDRWPEENAVDAIKVVCLVGIGVLFAIVLILILGLREEGDSPRWDEEGVMTSALIDTQTVPPISVLSIRQQPPIMSPILLPSSLVSSLSHMSNSANISTIGSRKKAD